MELHMADTVSSPAQSLVVVDLGKHKRKQINRLRKGEGGLVAKVEDVIAELRGKGVIGEGAQPVVIVVKEKRKVPELPLGGLLR
jgi:hypothetical protein